MIRFAVSTKYRYCRSTGAIAMIKTDLSDVYRGYIACLNKQDWPKLSQFVHDDVSYNGQRIGIGGYREMLERDFSEIPDLSFDIQLLISDPPYLASRLGFDCTPKGKFLGLHVNDKRVNCAFAVGFLTPKAVRMPVCSGLIEEIPETGWVSLSVTRWCWIRPNRDSARSGDRPRRSGAQPFAHHPIQDQRHKANGLCWLLGLSVLD